MANEGEEGKAFSNIFKNAVAQVDFRQTKQVFGVAEFVFIEVLVSYLLRYFIKADRKGIFELISVHLASVPFLGATADEEPHPMGLEAPLSNQFMVGARQLPAYFFGQYVVSTGQGGFHFPKPGIRDILIGAAGKILSRPITSLLYPYLGETFRTNLQVLEELIKNQTKNSFGGPKGEEEDRR